MCRESANPAESKDSSADHPRRPADETITRFEPWLQRTARGIAGSNSPYLEDVIQEGRLALWNALQTYDPSRGALPSWLVYKSRYRMYEVLQGKPWTGQPPRFHGQQGSKEPEHVLSLDAPTDAEPMSANVPAPRDTSDSLDSAELAYHDHELATALAKLSPQ